VLFPVFVLATFGWLVSKHHEKLFGPGDYKSDAGFLTAAKARIRHTEELRSQQSELKLKVREALTSKVDKDSNQKPTAELVERVISEIDKATTITVDARTFLADSSAIFVLPIAAFESIDALTNEIYFRINQKVGAYEYGYSWQLRNMNTGEILKTSRVITRTPPGTPVLDNRTLQEVNIAPGAMLIVELPNDR
jgi:hypothetical protein